MWTNENRAKYDRDRLRYRSDLAGSEWAHIAPLIPPVKRGGRQRSVDLREAVNGIMYVLITGRTAYVLHHLFGRLFGACGSRVHLGFFVMTTRPKFSLNQNRKSGT